MKTQKVIKELYGGDVRVIFYPKSHRYKLDGQKSYLPSVTTCTGIIDKSRQLLKWATDLSCKYIHNYVEKKGDIFTAFEVKEVAEEARDQYNKVRDRAGGIGSITHDVAEAYAKKRIGCSDESIKIKDIIDKHVKESGFEVTSENLKAVMNGVNAFLDWDKENDVEYLEVERFIYSKKHKFVGQTDVYGIVNGKRVLVDYKTSTGVYHEQFIQLAGYKIAFEEETGIKLDGVYLLHFCKEKGEFKAYYFAKKDLKVYQKLFLHCLGLVSLLKDVKKIKLEHE